MNNAIDLAFLTAKVATLKDEKAKMIVEGASLAYNITQVARFRSMIVELSQICNYATILCTKLESQENAHKENMIQLWSANGKLKNATNKQPNMKQ